MVPDGLRSVAQLVDERLERLFAAERAAWAAVDPTLVEAIDELARMSRGGKRLRAAFCYWGWLGASDGAGPSSADPPEILDAAAAFELLQAFALIHDDIMDDADVRRGEQTIHAAQAERSRRHGWRGEPRRYGEGVAILIGDLGHVYADQLIGTNTPDARRLWDQLRIELNLGQYLDMRSAATMALDRTTAARVATFKSALYTIVRPLQVGATLAHPFDAELDRRLDDYGRPAGQAFQLRDDLLGILGDATTVGKPVGHDLREGKPTELLAIALDEADTSQRRILDLVGRPNLSEDEISDIVATLEEIGAVEAVNTRIDELVADSLAALDRLPFNDSVRDTLAALARYVADRQH